MADATMMDHTYSCISKTVPRSKKRRNEEPQENLKDLGLEDRYVNNAAVIPDFCPPSIRTLTSELSEDVTPEESLSIHGRTIGDYQMMYHSLVDPLLKMPSGRHRPYSLDLGLRIKQRLWVTLGCPSFCEEVQDDGRILIREIFSTPTLKSFAPRIDVDISGEPLPTPPGRKKPRL